ncbi:MAG TPA: hypothetical protein DD717_00040 [Alcanivorax sp.]|nr:hypothetical protein [Alcanivorax sp.]HBP66639.1 hypothetical protein [Alcanivorax sp.]HBT05731.1 hypothetical protein [Alcanivorax sp.]
MGTGLVGAGLARERQALLAGGIPEACWNPAFQGLWDPAGSFAPFRGLMTTLAISGRRGLPLAKRMLV